MAFNINPVNLFRALSLALELSSGRLSRHNWRTAMIASRLAEQVGMDNWQRPLLIYAALLHDIGAAADWSEQKRLHSGILNSDIYKHAEAGYVLLKDTAQLGVIAKDIRHHHDFWDGSSPSGLAGKDIPLASRIICLADRMEIAIKEEGHIVMQRHDLLARLRSFSGILFDPDLVKALGELARQDSFWFDLVNPHYYNNFFRNINAHGNMSFNIDDILDIADLFATIVDQTSAFTGRHSRSVSLVSAFLAKNKGFSKDEIKEMRIAGLLHDLGKLSVPNSILEKPGKLDAEEVALIRQHTYFTYRILEQIDGFSTIAEWAAYHHETLDGSGYPFGIKGDNLKLGSRIVAVADVFTALVEPRPYRGSLPCQQVEKIMWGMTDNLKLDRHIVGDLLTNCQEAYQMVDMVPVCYR